MVKIARLLALVGVSGIGGDADNDEGGAGAALTACPATQPRAGAYLGFNDGCFQVSPTSSPDGG